MDNAGGSVPCRQVIDRVRDHMESRPVQLGASYALSVAAREAVDAGRRAAALLVGAEVDEIVLGASMTVLTQQLASVLRASWSEADEVVVTNLDHEANVGPWRRLEETGIVVREWRFRKDTLTLHVEDLEPLLSARTRLVAFTHCSNIVGTVVVDVESIAARIRAAGALSCVDGVALAPHRRIDVKALGVDFYLASLYKVYGPHLGLMFGRRELLASAKSPNHFFVPEDAVPTKLEPGNVNYELSASLPGILDYLETVSSGGPGAAFERIAAQEPRRPAARLPGRAPPRDRRRQHRLHPVRARAHRVVHAGGPELRRAHAAARRSRAREPAALQHDAGGRAADRGPRRVALRRRSEGPPPARSGHTRPEPAPPYGNYPAHLALEPVSATPARS
jgi:selenocysteine lyase/cysteine desulfurase